MLVDPDKISPERLKEFSILCEKQGADGFLIGGSLLMDGDLNKSIRAIKDNSSLPVIIFPGSIDQVDATADALLFISLISSRNAEQIIGKHIMAAPLIKKYGIEPLSTGYILVESGSMTTAEYMSESKPVPAKKPEIAAATALAAEYLGMKMIYLEAGSGAERSVPDEMVKAVSSIVEAPVIVGGGLRDSATIGNKVKNGASVIVVGNFFEDENNWSKISEFAGVIHHKLPLEV